MLRCTTCFSDEMLYGELENDEESPAYNGG